MSCYCPAVIAKENARSRVTKPNGFHLEEDEIGQGEKYVRLRTSLTADAFTPLLSTHLKTSGVDVQKLEEVQDLKDVDTSVPFPEQRLSDTSEDNVKHISAREGFEVDQLVGGFENARQAKLSLPRLKLGAINSQTGLIKDVDFEVEKRGASATGTPIRAQNSAAEVNIGKSIGGRGQPTPPTYRDTTLTRLSVDLAEEVRKPRPKFLNF